MLHELDCGGLSPVAWCAATPYTLFSTLLPPRPPSLPVQQEPVRPLSASLTLIQSIALPAPPPCVAGTPQALELNEGGITSCPGWHEAYFILVMLEKVGRRKMKMCRGSANPQLSLQCDHET